jgi:segregation and condensation protein A
MTEEELQVSAPEREPVAEVQTGPAQAEMPFAIVAGEAVTQLPQDLYIPPYALEVFLEAFEGPLDLLLYLIRRQNLDILNIPIAEITRQYVQYIELMDELQLELAGEYLLMAAMLAEIKSRMLLPRIGDAEDEEADPRAELVRRLQEYERYKQAATDLDTIPRLERETHQASAELTERTVVTRLPDLTLKELLLAFRDVLTRPRCSPIITSRASRCQCGSGCPTLLRVQGTRSWIFWPCLMWLKVAWRYMVTFLALLELLKESLIEVVQTEAYAPFMCGPHQRPVLIEGQAEAEPAELQG